MRRVTERCERAESTMVMSKACEVSGVVLQISRGAEVFVLLCCVRRISGVAERARATQAVSRAAMAE